MVGSLGIAAKARLERPRRRAGRLRTISSALKLAPAHAAQANGRNRAFELSSVYFCMTAACFMD